MRLGGVSIIASSESRRGLTSFLWVYIVIGVMRRRLRWRWIRAFAWRVLRTQYLMGVTVLIIAVAAAAGLGLFDADEGPKPVQRQAVVPTRTPVPYSTPIFFIPAKPLTVTYYLVDNEHDARVYESFEDRMIFREVLETDAIEILIIRNAEEQEEANRVLEKASKLAQDSGFILLVKDLR
jgi:hypothetical protein